MRFNGPPRWQYYPSNARPPAHFQDLLNQVTSMAPWFANDFWPVIYPASIPNGAPPATPHITRELASRLPARPSATPQHPYGLLPGWNFETRERYDPMPYLYAEGVTTEGTVNPDGAYLDVDRITLLEIEGGGAHNNNRGTKDIVETLLIPQVDYLALMLPFRAHASQPYKYYNMIVRSLYAQQVVQPHMKGMAVIGY